MPSKRHQLRDVYQALEGAADYDAWLAAAEEHDRLTGADQWRADDHSDHYDASALRDGINRLRRHRTSGDGLALGSTLTEHLSRHLNDLTADDLYDTAMAGPKHLVERYLDEAEASLRWIATTPIKGLSEADKLSRLETAWKVFGRSALVLSGGATWGFHHLGVIKALHRADVLPHILSGASTGAMVAAGVCSRNDAELSQLFADTDQMRLDGLAPIGLRGAIRTGAWLDPQRLYEVLCHNAGTLTFAEAWAHSGRVLNISVSPTRTRQKARLLNHLTSPEVLVPSAALASSALPGLYPPAVLRARDARGNEVPYVPSERWVDGSLHGDLPKQRLARLHNVNHFIVSQTNPHVLPFARHHGRRGLRPTLAGLAGMTIRSQGAFATSLVQGVGGPVGQVARQAHALVSQDYRGDIEIHPRFRAELLYKVVVNPSRQDLLTFIREGERATWPRLAMIRNQTRLGRAFREAVLGLRRQLRA